MHQSFSHPHSTLDVCFIVLTFPCVLINLFDTVHLEKFGKPICNKTNANRFGLVDS